MLYQKNVSLNTWITLSMVRCSYYESNSGTTTNWGNIRFTSPFSCSSGAYALVERGTESPTLFTFFAFFLSLPGKASIIEYGWELYSICIEKICYLKPYLFPKRAACVKGKFRVSAALGCQKKYRLWLLEWMSHGLSMHKDGAAQRRGRNDLLYIMVSEP